MIEHLAEGVTIYALHRPGDEAVRYVGKTIGNPGRRLVYHLQDAKRGVRRPLCHWLRKCLANDERPVIRVLEVVPPSSDWASREIFWIARFRSAGAKLLNLTEGGEGLAGHSFTEEHRQRIGHGLRKGAAFKCEVCPNKFWRKPRDIKAGDCRFCSRACYQASLRGVPKVVPALCTERGVAAAAARRRAQTHCLRGHALSGNNLFKTSSGARGCKECRKLHKRKHREKFR